MSAIELLLKLVLFSGWLVALMLVALATLAVAMIYGWKGYAVLFITVAALLGIEIVGRKLFKLLVGEYD